jgi:hypothetical protein
MYRSTFSWPQHWLEVSGQLHAPAALPSEKESAVRIGEEAWCAPDPVWTTWRRESSWPYWDSNCNPSVIQPVASRYTDWAIPAPSNDRGMYKVKFMLQPTFSRPVCFGVKPHLGPKTKFLLLSDICGFVDVGCSLWRGDGSVVYNCYWSSPAKSFSGPSPAGFMTIFYCLRFETPLTWRARSS